MPTVTKRDLVNSVSIKTRCSPDIVQEVVQALFDEVTKQLGNGNRIELRDFGVFSFKKRAARMGHNPRTLVKVPVKEKIVVSFKMGKRMKEVVGRLASAQEESPPEAAQPASASDASITAQGEGAPPGSSLGVQQPGPQEPTQQPQAQETVQADESPGQGHAPEVARDEESSLQTGQGNESSPERPDV